MEPEEMFKTSPANSEFVTRKELIDRKLKDAGWRIIKFDTAKPLAKYDRCAIEEYPTESGPADYALCVGGQILGVVEAKKLSLGPQNILFTEITTIDPISLPSNPAGTSIHQRNLLKARVVIQSYNHHIGSFSSEPFWLVQRHQVYSGLGSRHCHGINFTNNWIISVIACGC